MYVYIYIYIYTYKNLREISDRQGPEELETVQRRLKASKGTSNRRFKAPKTPFQGPKTPKGLQNRRSGGNLTSKGPQNRCSRANLTAAEAPKSSKIMVLPR